MSSDEAVPAVTFAPLLEFERDYVGTFGADEINALRAAHAEYADVPMLELGTIGDGTHFIIRGYVQQSGGRIVDALLFATGADSPMWSLTSVPTQTFDCGGGAITSIRGDERACRYEIGWQWSELGRTWRFEDLDSQSGGEFIDQLVLL